MHQAEKLYNDYWTHKAGKDQEFAYYDRLYAPLKDKFVVLPDSKVLDIAGGNGEFLRYLGIKSADIIDISDSGLEQAKGYGYGTIKADITKRFPIGQESYDYVFLCEVLEHLHHPNLSIAEAKQVLKPNGILYVSQPNMPPDGTYHVRRYYWEELRDDLLKSGFKIDWVDYVPAYSVPAAIIDDIKNNRSWVRKGIQCINLLLSWLPYKVRYQLAHWIPNRFGLIFVVKASKAV